jgi:hypothetical protein
MTVLALDHVQLAMPPGREAEARTFYAERLGLISATNRRRSRGTARAGR